MESFKKTVDHIANVLEKVLVTVSVIVLLMLVTTVSLQVFIRYVMKGSLPWVHEVSSGLLIWLTFIGSAYLIRGNRHLRVDMLIVKAPTWLQKTVNIFLDLLNMVFVIVLIYASYQLLGTQLQASLGVL